MDERIERGKMTREETQKLLASIQAIYPNFKVEPDRMTATVNAWHMMLQEYSAQAVNVALQMYVKTNSSGFPPSVSQLIGNIYKPQERMMLSEGEAWSLVKKAIQDGNYHAEERFNELPDEVQKAVGSANMIRQWAGTDSTEVNTVIMSNFQRAYKTVVERSKEDARISPLITGMIEAMEEKNLIGVNE